MRYRVKGQKTRGIQTVLQDHVGDNAKEKQSGLHCYQSWMIQARRHLTLIFWRTRRRPSDMHLDAFGQLKLKVGEIFVQGINAAAQLVAEAVHPRLIIAHVVLKGQQFQLSLYTLCCLFEGISWRGSDECGVGGD